MRTLRAFIWLRWRLLANTIRGGQRRDWLEQISRAVAMLLPVLLVALSLGSVIGMAFVGYLGGRALATGLFTPDDMLVYVRVVLGFVTLVIVFFAFWLPTQTSLSRYTRLLLLPISRRALHGVEFGAAVADPWNGFVAPALMTFAAGMALGGLLAPAAVAVAAGLALLATFAGLASLISFFVTWLFRSRRRSELFTLVFVMTLTLVSLLPAMIGGRFEVRHREAEARASFEDLRRAREARDAELGRWFWWSRAMPSELYARAVGAGLAGRPSSAGLVVAALGAEALLLFFASSAMHARLLGTVESRGRRRGVGRGGAMRRLPLLGPAASAVASAQVLTSLRSVRGRLSVLLPGPLLAVLAVIMRGLPDEARVIAVIDAHGYVLFGVGVVFSLYSFQAFGMNLFGTDRAGLSMQFLQPISDAELARGKIAGLGLVVALTGAVCLVTSLAVVPVGRPSLWLATGLAGVATYLWLSPIFVWLSALFPVAADLSKTGSGGNPHGLTMLAGTILVPVLALPAAAILVASEFWLPRPALAVPLMLGWLALAAVVSIPLLGVASRTIGMRRENLALVTR